MENNHINYVEFQASDLEKIKEFYINSLDWKFTDYGPDYVAFSECGLDGGFQRSENEIRNGALVILYNEDLEKIRKRIVNSGGIVSKDIFTFPGGRRFHFLDPAGNELAVWSEK